MWTILLVPLVYTAAVLEIWLAPHWQIRGATPDLLALVTIAWLTRARPGRGLFVAAMIGLAGDLGAAAPLGIGMASYALVAYAVIHLHRWMRLDWLPVQWIVVWLGTTLVALVQMGAARLAYETTLPWRLVLERGALVGLYTAGIALPALMIAGWLPAGSRSDSFADSLDGMSLSLDEQGVDARLPVGSLRS